MPTGDVLDFFVVCTKNITNILKDEKLIESIKTKITRDDVKSTADLINLGAEKINAIVPLLLNDHREDLYSIIAAKNKETIEAINSQQFGTTFKQAEELLKDEVFADFFASIVSTEKSAS